MKIQIIFSNIQHMTIKHSSSSLKKPTLRKAFIHYEVIPKSRTDFISMKIKQKIPFFVNNNC